MDEKWAESVAEKEKNKSCVEKGSGAHFAAKNMLKSFMYIKNYKKIFLILAFLLLYISMYLIHNVYGPLCIIKTNGSSSSADKGGFNEADIEVSKLYKANNANLFVSNVHKQWLHCRLFDSD